ncbi:hypothetical protein GCM10025876_05090 [Demequina litorisediminis]|uniref:CopC domain-containing protein n=1 Tax=Demequina litorisediminis TaxID=1849022 RepID=A0ABQ6IAD6_9MICO|nr:hypothetical protein GCM10025876_05090 [Demequina litorisediminis]
MWRIVAEDGHPIEGVIDFTYAPEGADATATATAEASPSAEETDSASPSPRLLGFCRRRPGDRRAHG